jgi:F-type H+-transporting ATPase subunit b
MPQLDMSTFASQLFWLAIIFVALYIVMKSVALPQVGRAIEARRQHREDDLGQAARMKTQAEAVLDAYEKTLSSARAEAQATLRETSERMTAEAAERQRQLAAALTGQIADAERRIAAGKDQALVEIRDVAVDVGRSVVEKLTGAVPDTARMEAAVDGVLPGRAG